MGAALTVIGIVLGELDSEIVDPLVGVTNEIVGVANATVALAANTATHVLNPNTPVECSAAACPHACLRRKEARRSRRGGTGPTLIVRRAARASRSRNGIRKDGFISGVVKRYLAPLRVRGSALAGVTMVGF